MIINILFGRCIILGYLLLDLSCASLFISRNTSRINLASNNPPVCLVLEVRQQATKINNQHVLIGMCIFCHEYEWIEDLTSVSNHADLSTTR
jgi:hypothetical protein